MAKTLKRKVLRNKLVAKIKIRIIKQLNKMPIIKKVNIVEVKKSFSKSK